MENNEEQFRLRMNMLIGTAMKRMLVGNDAWGKSKVMREVILDEMNGLNRHFNAQLDLLCSSGSSPI